MKLSLNIKTKLTLWYLLTIVILLIFFSAVAYVLLWQSLSRQTIHPWNIGIAQMEHNLDGSSQVTSLANIGQQLGMEPSSGVITVLNYTKEQLLELASKDGTIQFGNTDQPIYISKSLLITNEMSDNDYVWLYFFFSESNPDEYQLVVINQPSDINPLVLEVFQRTIMITMLVTLSLSCILGFFLVRKLLRPIQTITQTTQQIESQNLTQRLNIQSDDELGQLAETLNSMLERLEDAFKREKQFTADASHELRTPLAIIQGEASLALEKERTTGEYLHSLEAVARESERMSSILKRLLFLARDRGEAAPMYEDVNLTEFLNELSVDMEALHESKGVQFKLVERDNMVIKGDPILLRELFINLLGNSARYSPQKGTVMITLSRRENNACVAIKDDGPGIPPEHLEYIFERFYRVDKSRDREEGGTGLGLAISLYIAELHGGTIEVESKMGEGSIFSVLLPID